jgi:hypothetical protein
MRNIPISTGLIVLTVYFIISAFAWYTLYIIFQKGKDPGNKRAGNVLFLWSLLQAHAFFTLFIFPFNSASTTRYGLYFFYNSILISDFVIKIPLALSGFFALLFVRFSNVRSVIAYLGLCFPQAPYFL